LDGGIDCKIAKQNVLGIDAHENSYKVSRKLDAGGIQPAQSFKEDKLLGFVAKQLRLAEKSRGEDDEHENEFSTSEFRLNRAHLLVTWLRRSSSGGKSARWMQIPHQLAMACAVGTITVSAVPCIWIVRQVTVCCAGRMIGPGPPCRSRSS